MGLAFTTVEANRLWVLEKRFGTLSGQWAPERHEQAEETNESAVHDAVASCGSNASAEQDFVLNRLIIALMRKPMLNETEGTVLLQKVMR